MKKRLLNFLLMFLWAAITLTAVFHHELWRDEAQAWCIARDAGFLEMLDNARIEGHPVLWYLLLFLPAKFNLPPSSMQIISFLLTGAGVFLLIFKSKSGIFLKTAAVFSAGLLYYIPVIARNYSLIPPLLFLTALFWNKRQTHPFIYALLIILLSQTHSYMLGISAVLGIIFLMENYKKYKTPCILILLNFLFLFFWFKTGINENYALLTKYKKTIPPLELTVFLSKIYLFDIVNTIKPLIKYAAPFSVCFFAPFVILGAAGFFKTDKKLFAAVSFGILFIFCVFSSVYFNGILYQKLYLLILILLFGCIAAEKKNRLIDYSVNFLLLISCISSFPAVKGEILYSFSGGKETAAYIKQAFPDEKIIAAYGNPYLYSSISAYLPDVKLYSPAADSYISYYTFKPILQFDKEINPSSANIRIYITDEKIEPETNALKPVFESSSNIMSSRTEREVFKVFIKS